MSNTEFEGGGDESTVALFGSNKPNPAIGKFWHKMRFLTQTTNTRVLAFFWCSGQVLGCGVSAKPKPPTAAQREIHKPLSRDLEL